MIRVRPHLGVWYVWRNSQHVATITQRPHPRFPFILHSAQAPRITLAHCPSWHAAKQIAREYYA
jgi:hypothetical protein